jgi:hypothetical protein
MWFWHLWENEYLRIFYRNEEERIGFDMEEFKNFTQVVDQVTSLTLTRIDQFSFTSKAREVMT